MNELPLAEKWIHSKLAGDSEITALVGVRIRAEEAIQGWAFPYVLYSHHAGFDTRGNGTVRIQTNPTYWIRVVCDGNPKEDARTVAHRIDELFQEAVTEVSDGYVFSSRRTEPRKYPEPKKGKSGFYTHLGGLFRLAIYPAA